MCPVCAHGSVECQRQNSSLRMTGAGRGNGEPHETFNAYLGPLGRTTMYMTPVNRMVGHAYPLKASPSLLFMAA